MVSSPAPPEQPRFAYLLLTHRNPPEVEDLARRILDVSTRAQIVVHHDAKAPTLPWAGHPPEKIHLVERGPVAWGDWSMLDATLRMLHHATERLDADWFVLLSGEHRPTVDLMQWEAATAASGNDALLGAVQLADRLRFGGGDFDRNQYLARSLHRWSLVARPRHPALHYSLGLLAKLSARTRPVVSMEYIHRRDAWAVGIRRRRRPVRGWTFFRGSQWVAVNRRAAGAALSMDPEVVEWFKKSWIPDEAFLHTALRRDPRLRVANTPTTFVLDTPPRPYPGWMQLSLDDLPATWASGLPFARKVDAATRPEVIARIDQTVDREIGHRTGSAAHAGPHTAAAGTAGARP